MSKNYNSRKLAKIAHTKIPLLREPTEVATKCQL